MSVFKRKRRVFDKIVHDDPNDPESVTDKTKAVEDSKYSIDFTDHNGQRRRVPAFTDKSASYEMERNVKRLVSIKHAGDIPDKALSKFLETAPERVCAQLAKWGIIEAHWAMKKKSLPEYVEDWRIAMERKGNGPRHTGAFVANFKKVAKYCKWVKIHDISAPAFERWMAEQKAKGKSATTINHHLRAAKAFCSWLVRSKFANENALASIALLNAALDRRRIRRAFSDDEMTLLLAVAESGRIVNGMTGYSRALLYRLATETGLRWSECYSLTKSSFNFEGEIAFVTIRAEHAKNRREDSLPLRPELARDLKEHMALLQSKDKAFPGMWKNRGAEMVKFDLKAAGIPYIDANGHIGDFHAFRHTFATNLSRSRVSLVMAQKFMRHHDPKLTSNIYTHASHGEMAAELAKLPNLTLAPSSDESQIADTEIGIRADGHIHGHTQGHFPGGLL